MNANLIDTCKQLTSLLENPQGDSFQFSKTIFPLFCEFSKLVVGLDSKFIDYPELNEEIALEAVRYRLKTIFKGEALYNQVFDPLEDNEAVTFSLVNDLCETYEGLLDYLRLVQINPQAAEWALKENFRSHLHQHVLNSIKILYIGYSKDE